MGRQIDYDTWKCEKQNHEYLEKLTIAGFGEITFAAYYPSCHSVFGCYDAEITKDTDLDNLSYEVVGWYDDKANELLQSRFFQEEINRYLGENTANSIKDLFEQYFGWKVEETFSSIQEIPKNTVCYAQIDFTARNSKDIKVKSDKNPHINVAIGSTGIGALSKLLSQKLTRNYELQRKIEEQLENIQLLPQLGNQKLDKSQKLAEARHEQSFTAVSGGKLWVINQDKKEKKANLLNDSIEPDQALEQVIIPESLATPLNLLNSKQKEYDRTCEEIKMKKRHLFSYWYKYMVCSYPPNDGRHDYPSADEARYYIETKIISSLNQLENKAKVIKQKHLDSYNPLSTKRIQIDKIENFNSSKIPERKLILQKLFCDKQNDSKVNFYQNAESIRAADQFEFNSDSFVKSYWQSNFSKKQYLLISKGLNKKIKAVSLWINIANQQEDNNPTLFATDNDESIISLRTIGNIWNKFVINGKELDILKKIKWHNLPKDQFIHLYFEASEHIQNEQNIFILTQNMNHGFLNAKIASLRLFSESLDKEEISLDKNILGHAKYKLEQKSAPRYWRPNEPIILMESDIFKSEEYAGFYSSGEKNLLSCKSLSLEDMRCDKGKLSKGVAGIKKSLGSQNQKSDKWCHNWIPQHWHLLNLEWEVLVSPIADKGNLDPNTRKYEHDYITANFENNNSNNDLNLKLKGGIKSLATSEALYNGNVFFTPGSKFKLLDAIKNYLMNLSEEDFQQPNSSLSNEGYKKCIEDYEKCIKGRAESDPDLLEEQKLKAFIKCYKSSLKRNEEKLGIDPIYTAIEAYHLLKQLNVISQSLAGFNSALLMQRQTMQLPMHESLGFDSYNKFTSRVKELVGKESKYAPLPQYDFNPIINGKMKILNLRIVDSFGRYKDIVTPYGKGPVTANICSVDSFKSNNQLADPFELKMPPRFIPPTRLNFRWLNARDGAQEMNFHPLTTPICGWLLANNLDESVMVYDQDGVILGIIRKGKTKNFWDTVPGNDYFIDYKDIPNKYLKNVIKQFFIENQTGSNILPIEHFISATDKILEKIDPENFKEHQYLALLMGRPMAVVRASINFEVRGGIPINQSWTAFRQELSKFFKNLNLKSFDNTAKLLQRTDEVEKVDIPVHIGEHDQYNDGLIGYWKEEKENLKPNFYVSLNVKEYVGSAIKSCDPANPIITKTLSSTDVTKLTMLIDPKAKVHASCCILPKKFIDIPPDQYKDALSAVQILFQATPIISSMNHIALPLSNVPSCSWSWIQHKGSKWHELSTIGIVKKKRFAIEFAEGLKIWQELSDKGWIRPINPFAATVVGADQRINPELSKELINHIDKIEQILNDSHIIPVETEASFNTKNAIHEGWLKITNLK
jgi:hypothetical protein